MALVSIVTNDLQLFCPIFYCVFSLCFFLVFGCFVVTDTKRFTPLVIIPFLFMSLGVFFILFFICFNLPSSQAFSIFFGHCVVDFSCYSFWLLSLILVFMLFFCAQGFGSFYRLFLFETYAVFILSWVGIAIAVRATSFLVLFLGLELQALSFYVLVAIRRTSSITTERALKYFLLGAFSSGIFIFGVALVYNETGSLLYASVARYFFGSRLEYTAIVGALLILRALLFKLGRAPLHQWVPDIYEGSSTLVGAYFSTVPKFAIILVIFRICQRPFSSLFEWWGPFLLLTALISLVVGTFGALGQQKIKRFIAYSSIGHSGFLLLGQSVGTIERIFRIILYSIFYLVSTLLLWLVLIAFSKRVNKFRFYPKGFDFFAGCFPFYFSDVRSLFILNKPLSILFLIRLLSTAGIPPFGGFISKFLIIFSLLSSGFYLPSFIVVFSSVLSVFYYLRWVKFIFFDVSRYSFMQHWVVFFSLRQGVSLALSSLGFILCAYFFYPEPLLVYSQRFLGSMFERFMLPVLKTGAVFISSRGFESHYALFRLLCFIINRIMYLILVFLPLLGALCAGFIGNIVGSKGSVYLTISSLFITFFLSTFIFIEVGITGAPLYLKTVPWLGSAFFSIYWEFYFDSLTSCIIVVVSSISTLVHVYGSAYMKSDPHRSRFIAYLSLFTFFILILVTAGNYLQLFVGWEGVGVCSYLLINFWFTRLQSNKAAIKAIVVNRVGDVFFCLGLVLILGSFGTLSFSSVFSIVPLLQGFSFCLFNYHFSSLSVVSLLLFLGAAGKSAQLFLHTWLPDAIEGPTPVSALIHAATIVTAGVFLLVRSSPFLEYAPTILSFITVFGAFTAFVAATVGLFQNDLKRVIAYSTCSQLGYMVFACGLSNYSLAIFHLSNHAFFKALLFLCAGAVIHAVRDEQDLRRLGGLLKVLPFTYSIILIGSLSLIGFPFLTGFYSKDLIIEVAYGSYSRSSHFAHLLGSFAAFFTAFYSIRLLFLTFIAKPICFRVTLEGAHDPGFFIGLSLFILSWGALFVGYLGKDLMALRSRSFWGYSIFVYPDNCAVFDSEFLPFILKLIPVFCSIAGALVAFVFYFFYSSFLFYIKFSTFGRKLYRFFNRKWLFDYFYTVFVNQPFFHLGFMGTYFIVDRGFFELLGPSGFSSWVRRLISTSKRFQRGHLVHYASCILWWILFVIGFLLLYSLFFVSSHSLELGFLLLIILFVKFLKSIVGYSAVRLARLFWIQEANGSNPFTLNLFKLYLFLFMVFNCFFATALFSSVGVIVAAHPVHSVLYLVLAFFNVAALLIIVEADVLGLLFLIVYVGAIAVLFLFVVMMLDLKRRSLSAAQFIPIIPAVLIIGFVFFFEFFLILVRSAPTSASLVFPRFNSSWEFFDWFLFLDSFSPLVPLGQTLYSFYVLSFLLGGLVLLIALIGALVLTLPAPEGDSAIKRQLITYQLTRRLDSISFFLLLVLCIFFGGVE